MRQGDYPIRRETGVPNISIPIFTAKSGELSLPISLSYHAGGNKVDDIASWVGLGWNLNAGGMISRTIRGTLDESSNGLLYLKDQYIPFFDAEGILDVSLIDEAEHYDHLIKMRNGQFDTEPDEFSYNFSGHSGKFYLIPNLQNPNQPKVLCQPKSDIKFTVNVGVEGGYKVINEIVATTPEGVKYFFNVVSTVNTGNFFSSGHVTWYLKEIRNPDYPNNESRIILQYRDLAQTWNPVLVQSHNLTSEWEGNTVVGSPSSSTRARPYVGAKVLSSISFSNGSVVFNSSDNRSDLYKTRLTSIDVFDDVSVSPIKSFVLSNNSYFSTSGGTSATYKRMKLTAIQEFGNDGVSSKPPYEFTYLESGNYELPVFQSYKQDYWGFKNGNTFNSHIPKITVNIDGSLYTLGAANKEPHSEYMKAGIIRSIKYPTGGKSVFEFEPNSVKYTYPVEVSGQGYTEEARVFPNSSTRTKITTFTFPNQLNNVSAQLNYSIGSAGGTNFVGTFVELKDVTANSIKFSQGGNQISGTVEVILIPNHQYRLEARGTGDPMQYANLILEWSDPSTTEWVTTNKVVGGLRVINIKNYNSNDDLLTQKTYEYDSPEDGYSSGVYNSSNVPIPEDYLVKSKYWNECGGYDFVWSASNTPFHSRSFPSGDLVTYRYVTETDGDGSGLNGKSVYQHDIVQDGLLYTPHEFLGFELRDQGYLRGNLVDEKHYNATDDLLRHVSYLHETITLDERVKAMRVGLNFEATELCLCGAACDEGYLDELRQQQIDLRNYQIFMSWKRLKTKTELVDGVSTITQYYYDPDLRHTNIVAIEVPDGTDDEIRTEFKYAHEVGEAFMRDYRNMVGIPLESRRWKDGILLGGSKLIYGSMSGLYVPQFFYEELTDQTFRLIAEVNSVASTGKLRQISTNDGITKSTIWDIDEIYPMASVVNGDLGEIAFTSFESGSNEGGWSFVSTPTSDTRSSDAKFGAVSFRNASITKSNLPSQKYRVGFWAKRTTSTGSIGGTVSASVNHTDWRYYSFETEVVTTVLVSVSATVLIDDLRLCPTDAQMTSYSHKPLVGISSQTDHNGRVLHYIYDTHGRLSQTIDHHGNVLEEYTYNYKN
ncbi:hypothetical protein [Marinoscillum luteum]|uniref:YD repeat-containing protein n=1 Tax=Marinoscillum luteum TaxID=861051 RepID=A0ABW7NEI4_9BACT